MAKAADAPAAILIRGDDLVLRADAVRDAVNQAAGGEDLTFGLDDFSGEDYELAAVIIAAQTPPTFTTRRVVVAREVGRFSADQAEPLLQYLASPCPTTVLVLVGGGGTVSKKIVDAAKKVGSIVDAGAPTGKARQQWMTDHLHNAPVRLDARASARLAEHLGDDIARFAGIMSVLEAVHGTGARVGVDQLEPFLGAAGSGAPWDLTDAIDRGDVGAALGQLGRQMGSGERHPLQIMASLHAHFGRMLRLDGAGARDESEAAGMLGMAGSTFPAKKALTQARKLGTGNVKRAITLLAEADLDLRGQRDLPGGQVMEILVARLTRLAASSGRR
jgi:DNA polymerase-3 subunit delta